MIAVEIPGFTGWDTLVLPTITHDHILMSGCSSSSTMSLSGTPLSQLPSATLSQCSDFEVQK
jgi:hypothetical protein